MFDFLRLCCMRRTGKLTTTLHAQAHCFPRPGKQGTRVTVYDTPNKFCFHHVNAFEAPDGAIVIDTVGRNDIDFGAGTSLFSVESYSDPAAVTTLRRIVCRGGEARATEHDLRQVPALRNRSVEFPAQMPADVVARPHNAIFLRVRDCLTFKR